MASPPHHPLLEPLYGALFVSNLLFLIFFTKIKLISGGFFTKSGGFFHKKQWIFSQKAVDFFTKSSGFFHKKQWIFHVLI